MHEVYNSGWYVLSSLPSVEAHFVSTRHPSVHAKVDVTTASTGKKGAVPQQAFLNAIRDYERNENA